MTISEAQQCIVLTVWEDSRNLIAALKVQRWEVTKWTVAINIGLAGASAVSQQAMGFFIVFAMIVAVIGGWLLFRYNQRITNVRKRLTKTVEFIRAEIYDVNLEFLGDDGIGRPKDQSWDWDELVGFMVAIILSLIPIIVAALTLPVSK